MNQASVLIISDQPGFARDIVSHWQLERTVPAFTMMSSEFWSASSAAPCDLIIVGGAHVAESRLTSMLKGIDDLGTPCICVVEQASAFHHLRSENPRVLPLKQDEEWLSTLVVLGVEVLRRGELAMRLRRADQSALAQQRQATLGRYMLEMRHGFNNALTAVLGNAELLMLDGQGLSPQVREQVETIQSMALRLHEMMQRFSSLEAELTMEERDLRGESQTVGAAYLPGSFEENGPGR
ncbi:MAG: hypothetical protein HYX26_10925 [Acidobacteriales bacterium]|nr:hypothetical protein [Terriglobales bacterium]